MCSQPAFLLCKFLKYAALSWRQYCVLLERGVAVKLQYNAGQLISPSFVYFYTTGVPNSWGLRNLPKVQSSVSQNLFPPGPLSASKNNHGSSHPCSGRHRVSGWEVSKTKNFYIGTDFSLISIRTSSIRNNVSHDLTLIKMTVARFVGSRSFVFRYSNNYTK